MRNDILLKLCNFKVVNIIEFFLEFKVLFLKSLYLGPYTRNNREGESVMEKKEHNPFSDDKSFKFYFPRL